MSFVGVSRVPGFLSLSQSHVLEYVDDEVVDGGDVEGCDGVEDYHNDHEGEEDYEAELREHCCVHFGDRVCGLGCEREWCVELVV